MSDGRGGARAGAGRPKGAVDGSKRLLARLAAQHTAKAVEVLAKLMEDEDVPPAARIKAASDLLDRAHGKPFTAPAEEGDVPTDGGLADPDPSV